MSNHLLPPSLAGGKLDRYFHVCAFFNSRDEEYRVLLPFVKEGLQAGEKAIHIWDPQRFTEHRERLRADGIEAARCELSGQLEILSAYDVYLQGGRFEPEVMLAVLEQALAAGKAQGYARSRILGHMEWALEGHPGTERILEYEVKVNEVLARSQQPACCIYDINLLSAGMMMDILRAHPLTIVGGVLHENPFFTPPEQYLEELRARREGARSLAVSTR